MNNEFIKNSMQIREYFFTDDYRKAISKGIYNTGVEGSREWKEDMLFLRLGLWRSFNAQFLSDSFENQSVDDKKAYADNCRELLELLEGKLDDKLYLLKAEIYRNLGMFDECRQVLKKIIFTEDYAATISAIRNACYHKNTLTVLVE